MAQEEKNVYRCRSCGAEVRFDVKQQKFLCTACRAEYAVGTEGAVVAEKNFDIQRMLVSSAELAGVKAAKCGSCGGEIFFSENETASRCPMCGASQLREDAAKVIIRPDGVVPFRIDAQDAQQSFRKFLTKRFFAPSALKSAFEEGRLEGWYLPFWTFDARADGSYSGEGGRDILVERNGQKVSETLWTPVSGGVRKDFDDVLVCAAGESSRKMVGDIDRYDTHAAKPYAPEYLQGYLAEYRSMEAEPAFAQAQREMISELESQARSDIRSRGFTSDRFLRVRADFTNVTCKNLLLPVYRARYNFEGKLYDYIINGQTGQVSAHYPKSALKIILTILAAAIVIAAIVMLVKMR